jgi:hypothetical protein
VRAQTIVIVGTAASDPYAGMAWMTMQIVCGLRRLGHDAWYFEVTSTWPYDPQRAARVADSEYAVPYLERLARRFGLQDRWAYRRSYSDEAWFGLPKARAEALLSTADLVFNIAGATRLRELGLKTGRVVYFGTDPVFHEIRYASGDLQVRSILDDHDDVVTYGENIGNAGCPIPPLPRLRARTRQPVLLDMWEAGAPTNAAFTTVGNWKQAGRDVEYEGEVYRWSKHHEFKRFIDLPRRVTRPIELATNLAPAESIWHGRGTEVPVFGFEQDEYALLQSHGWRLVDAPSFTTDPWRYRDYVIASSGEYTVARDLNVRLSSGWFSERSACYLAAGRPVITQDTGFGCALPTGKGLFAYNSIEEAVAAFEAVDADYELHSRAAREIAAEYFRAETVLANLVRALD